MPPTNQPSYQPTTPRTATAGAVIRLFWAGMKKYRLAFLFAILTIALSGVVQVYIPIFYKNFFDVLTTTQNKAASAHQLIMIIFTVLGLNVVYWALVRYATFTQNVFQAKIIAKLRQNAFDYMIEHSYTFFANNFTGSLTQRVNRFARAFDTLCDQFLWTIVPLAVNVVGVIIVLWGISHLISIVVFFWVLALFIFNYFFSLWKVKYDIASAALDSRATAVLSDSITNQNAVQLFTGYGFEQNSYKAVTNEQAKATIFSWNLAAVVEAVQSSLVFIAEFLLFYFAISLWIKGSITIGTFVLIQAYFIGLGGRLWNLSRVVRLVYEGFADAKEMGDIMLLPHENQRCSRCSKAYGNKR